MMSLFNLDNISPFESKKKDTTDAPTAVWYIYLYLEVDNAVRFYKSSKPYKLQHN